METLKQNLIVLSLSLIVTLGGLQALGAVIVDQKTVHAVLTK